MGKSLLPGLVEVNIFKDSTLILIFRSDHLYMLYKTDKNLSLKSPLNSPVNQSRVLTEHFSFLLQWNATTYSPFPIHSSSW